MGMEGSHNWAVSRATCFVPRAWASTRKAISTWWMGFGPWCRCSIMTANCCTPLAIAVRAWESSSCRPDSSLIVTIASLWWIPSTGGCRSSATTAQASRPGEVPSEARVAVRFPAGRNSAAGANHGRCDRHARSLAGQQVAHHRRTAGIVLLLPRSAFWSGDRQHALEPDPDQSDLPALYQQHLSPEGTAADAGLGQQLMFELPRRDRRCGEHDCFRTSHHDRFHEQPGCAGDEPAELASFQPAVAH